LVESSAEEHETNKEDYFLDSVIIGKKRWGGNRFLFLIVCREYCIALLTDIAKKAVPKSGALQKAFVNLKLAALKYSNMDPKPKLAPGRKQVRSFI
jgi:hypothetical protein